MILEQVREIIVNQLGVKEEDIALETNFIDDLGVDSLDLFQLVMEFEDAFGISVENPENIKTVGDAVKYIESAKGE